MSIQIPMGVLGWVSDADNGPLRAKIAEAKTLLKDLGAEASKDSRVQELFRDITTEADKATRAITPASAQVRAFAKEYRDLSAAVKSGTVPVEEGAKRFRELETAIKTQLGTLSSSDKAYTALQKVMKLTSLEAQQLEKVQRSSASAYDTAEVTRYAGALKDILTARKAGIVSDRDALTQVKSLSGAMAQYAGSLKDGSREQQELNKVMAATGTAARQLEAAQDKVEAAFRADFLRTYAGELKQVDAAVRSGSMSFGAGQREVEKLTTELREQQGQLGTTGREFDSLSKLLQQAAAQQERYQKAAEAASRKDQVGEIRALGTELKTLEGQLKDATSEWGRLDSQQRALKYDTSGLKAYRTETESLGRAQESSIGSFDKVGRGLETLRGKLADYGQGLEKNSKEHADLERVMQGVEKATTSLASAQEKAQKAYQAAELSRFVTELKSIETAQKQGVISAGDAAKAIERLQLEFKDYAASLGVAESELSSLAGAQKDASTSAASLATAQEKATKSFDKTALRDFRGELERVIQEVRSGEGSFDEQAQAVEKLQGRMREYGTSLENGSREQQELNKVLDLSEKALRALADEAEKVGTSFDERPVADFRTELGTLEGAGRELGTVLDGVEGELQALGTELRETGSSAGVSAQEQKALAGVMAQLEGATDRLAESQRKAQEAFHAENVRQQVSALNDLKLQLERGVISQEQFSTSAREIGTALEQARNGLESSTKSFAGYTGALTKVESSLAQAEGRVRTFGVASGVTAGVGDQLQNLLYGLGPAGEAAGVAMMTAGAGMEKASLGAKLLNVALAAGLVGVLVAVGVGIGSVIKQSEVLNTGLTDVAKTTGFTKTELADLARNLQGIALATGTPVKNLLELAGVAGSLGVTGVANVTKFTDTLNKLTIATDIVGEEGAEKLAKFINVTKDANQSVGDAAELVGNLLTRLGNDLAATEAPILSMAQRLGSLKVAAGVSQTDILGLAGAFVSLGVSAELGGTNVTKIFTNMSLAASRGGAELKAFAGAAGVTTEEFKRLVKEQPADAFVALVEGLRSAKDAGEDINPTLQRIVGNNNEMRSVLLAAVGGIDTFRLALNGARDEAVQMTALQNELNTRLASQKGSFDLLTQSVVVLRDTLALKASPAITQFYQTLTNAALSLAKFIGVIDQATFDKLTGGLEKAKEETEKLERAQRAANILTDEQRKVLGEAEDALDGYQIRTGTTASALDALSKATGEAGFKKALDGLIGSLKGDARTAMENFAASTALPLAAQGDLAGAFKAVTEQMVLQEIQALKTTIAQQKLAKANLGTSLQQLNRDLSDVMAKIQTYNDDLANATNEAQRYAAEMAMSSPAFYDLRDAARALADQASATAATQGTLSDSIIKNEAHLAELEGQLLDVKGGTDNANASFVSLLDTFGANQAAIRASVTATEALNAIRKSEVEINKLNKKEAQEYLEQLKQTRTIYPENKKELTALITTTKAHIESLGKSTDANNEDAEASETAAEAKRALEKATGDVEEAQKALVDTTELTADKARDMADGLEEAAERTDAIGAAARAAQMDLRNFAVQAEFVEGLKEDLKGAADSFLEFIDPIGETSAALAEVEVNARLFSDTTDVASQKAEIFRNRMTQLSLEGRENGVQFRLAAAQYEFWQTKVEDAENAAAAWSAEVERQQGIVDSLTERLGGLGESFTDTLSPMGDLNAGLAEIDRNAKLTGDSSQVAADKAELYQTAMLALAGILGDTNPLVVMLQQNFERFSEKAQQQAKDLEDAAAAAERFKTNTDLVNESQRLLSIGAGATSEQLFQMALDLADAAKGSGELGAKARELQTALVLQAAELDKQAKVTETAAEAQEAYSEAMEDGIDVTGKTSALLRDFAGQIIELAGGYEKLTPAQKALVDGLRASADAIDQATTKIDALNVVVGVLEHVSSIINLDGLNQQLNTFLDMRGDLLNGEDYDAAEFQRLTEEIARVRGELEKIQTLGYVFEGLIAGAGALATAIQEGKSAGEQANLALAAGITAIGEAAAGSDKTVSMFFTGFGTAAAQLASGDWAGAIVTSLGTILSLLENEAKELDRTQSAIDKYGKEWLIANGYLQETAGMLFLNEAALADYEAGLDSEALAAEEARKRAEDLHAEWEEGRKQLQENKQELAEYTAEIRDNNNAAAEGARDARLRFAEVSGGATEAEMLIAETILGLQDAAGEFNSDWAQFQQDYNDTIAKFLAANPGASMAEARQYAENLLGPRRDAMVEGFAYTSATILAEAGKQAKELGLSQEQFYTAVLTGNTELLGDMTEGQRQALLQVIQVMREMGIELPPALEAAFGNVDEAGNKAAADSAAATAEQTKARIQAIEDEKTSLTQAWKTRETYLKQKIAETSGAERDMYEQMLALEKSEYLGAMQERNDEIDAINQESAEVDVKSLEERRDKVKEAYDAQMKEITEALKTATGAEREALLQRQADLTSAYITTTQAINDTINEEGDGVGSALEASAQSTVDSINEDIRNTNSAWATRSAELKALIANSTGEVKAQYEQMYAEESAAYESSMSQLQTDLVSANQALLDAQDASSEDFIAAQEEVGRKEQEALGGIFELLRQILGPDAEIIISMIQNTYNARRQAYLSEGAATADAAATANQSELDALGGIYEQLRALLGPDAEIIISMIQGTYDKRQAAYQQGSSGAAQAAADAGNAEAQSIQNITDLLYQMFGPEAQAIIDMINELYEKRANAYGTGGANAGAAASAAAETEAQSVQNINDLLYQLFGPEAQAVIDLINELYRKKQEAYAQGGTDASGAATDAANQETDAINSSTDQVGGALDEQHYTLEDLLARNDLTPALREAGERLDAALREGGDLTEAEIQANRDKLEAAINDRGARIQALVESGVPLDEAVRRVDEELAATWNTTADLIEGSVDNNAEQVGGSIERRTARVEELVLQGMPLADAQRQVDSEFANAVVTGSQTLNQGLISSVFGIASGFLNRQNAITTGQAKDVYLAGVEKQNVSLLGGAFSEFGPTIGTALGNGTKAAVDATKVREALLGGAFSSTYSSLSTTYLKGTGTLSTAVVTGGADLNGRMSTTLVGVGEAFSSRSSLLNAALSGGFDRTKTAYLTGVTGVLTGVGSGSAALVSKIEQSYSAEQAKFQQKSAELVSRIQAAKGSERTKLEAEYRQLQAEHEAKSRAYQSAIDAAARGEAGSINSSAQDLVRAYTGFGNDGTREARDAYTQMEREHEARSRAYQAVARLAGTQIAAAVVGSGTLIGNGFSSALNAVLPRLGNFFSSTGGEFTSRTRTLVGQIDSSRSSLDTALDRYADLIKNFKFPALPKPPTLPSPTRVSADAGDFSPSTLYDPPVGAFAATGPEFGGSGSEAYAADAFDFSGLTRSLSLASRAERSTTINLRLERSEFDGAAGQTGRMLQDWARSLWDIARYQRSTAEFERETAEMQRENVVTSIRDLAKRPRR